MADISRRNFVKYASGASATAMLAGCNSNGNGGNGNGGNGNGNGGNGNGNGGDGGDAESPVEWIGPAWSAYEEQGQMVQDVTGREINITSATIPTVQQRILGGENETIDVVSVDTAGSGALTIDNDVTESVSLDDLDNWQEDTITDALLNPSERLSHLGQQAETLSQQLWEDEERTELKFPPHVYNFDAIGYNPGFVDDVSLWSALFDDQYQGETIVGETAAITIPEVMMHLLDTDQLDAEIGSLNNPTQDQMDAAIDFLIEQSEAGQFRTTWAAYGESVGVMSGEEAVLGDIWQPAAMDVRRDGAPCIYATMDDGVQGYRFWYGGIVPTSPGASNRGNLETVHNLIDAHYGAHFPSFIQGYGYSTPHYENEELVRDGSDETGEGMGPEYYDWAYRGEATYEPVDDPAMFDPQEYEWADEEGEPDPDGSVRNSGPIEERFDRTGFFQIWPDEADYMTDRWRDFLGA
jgi:putative spermidine/putrescine transport system substrate-binding protein